MKKIFLFLLFPFLLSGISIHSFSQEKEKTLHQLNSLLVNVVMDDLFNPPVASRIYVYPNIAFYECIRNDDPSLPTLTGKLNGFKKLPTPGIHNNNFISACIAFSWVAQGLVGSEYKLENWRAAFLDSLKKAEGQTNLDQSVAYGKRIADSISLWIRKDNYLETRGMMRHVTTEKEGGWLPTPNDYAQGLEPHWNKIRPLTLSSPSQFSPKTKLKYSTDKNSVFYKNILEVYNTVKSLDTNKKYIALYWDDNPNATVHKGHLSYFIHKVAPGGHWILIAKQACELKKISVQKSSQTYTLTAIALFDATIATWDEKYKTDLIRPVTFINQHIDEKWLPYLDTPPFPEFTSGHAVVSNAASAVLTHLLGENFSFTDDTEIPFGYSARSFTSFNEASKEATWSRVYGGIHYPETAKISIDQGQQIGKYVIRKLSSDKKTGN